MRRYLAFAGNYTPARHLKDFRGDFDKLLEAKSVVQSRDSEGFPVHDWGTVLDMQTGQVHDWQTDGRAFGSDQWRFPAHLDAQ